MSVMVARKSYPTREDLLELFEFREVPDEHSERNIYLFWRERPLRHFKTAKQMKSWNTRYVGKRAGGVKTTPDGYSHRKVSYKSSPYHEHVLIHIVFNDPLFCLSDKEVDHRDENSFNNSPGNLREATSKENKGNRGIHRNNKNGLIGVAEDKGRKLPWRAQANNENGKRINLGRFLTKEKAALAYDNYVRSSRGEFAFVNFAIEGSKERALNYVSPEQYRLMRGFDAWEDIDYYRHMI